MWNLWLIVESKMAVGLSLMLQVDSSPISTEFFCNIPIIVEGVAFVRIHT